MSKKPHIMIAEAQFYHDISENLAKGAIAALEEAGATYERFAVPGALEIPAAIKFGMQKKFDGYIALGCVVRGETSHYDVVANESARGLTDLSLQHDLAIGNGVLTCDTMEQALVRSDPGQKDKGGHAAHAVLALLAVKEQVGAA